MPVHRSDNFVRVYSNNAGIVATPFDFVLTFGEVHRTAEKTYVEQTVSVTMSPQHVKALTVILFNNLKEYEKHVGPIPLPQGETPKAETDNSEERHKRALTK